MSESPYVSRQDAALYLKVSERSIDRMIEEGRLPAYLLNTRTVRIKTKDLDALLRKIVPA